ncbi:MAG: outer membrane protein transport protein [Rhodoferax sp.]|uniref:OmpP1/FadL family transporter n=1 Tax=Rhodoferax sp. TaxID=50421 RepID=UPI00301924F1
MKPSKSIFYLTPLCALLAAGSVHATNGMLMEGYGPISTGMGGASQAIDHGNAGMAQNPATLGMMPDGTSRLDVAFGILGPDVKSSVPGMEAKSGGTSYLMPAFGYVKRNGAYTYGIGMFAQGGMGTEYAANSFMAGGFSLPARSELGVGNVIFPVAYQVNSNLTVGATLKFMWASLDLQMAAPRNELLGMMTGSSGKFAAQDLTNPLATATKARISFSDENDFTGAAKSTGFGASLGAVYKVNKDVTVGGSYQFKSGLDDMKTASSAASIASDGAATDYGQMTVIDFQMPSVFAVGASWQAQPSLLLAADIKYIGWADSMKSFKMRYDSSMGNGSVSFAMPQNWKDQTVLNLGMAWKANEQLTLRAGLNLADNPIPDAYVNPLFPATVKSHVTLGMGYKVSEAGDFNASLTLAPSETVTSGSGVTISHGQTNLQVMYSHRF